MPVAIQAHIIFLYSLVLFEHKPIGTKNRIL
jgi:hypothetical protein